MNNFAWYRKWRGGRWGCGSGLIWGKRWIKLGPECVERADEDWSKMNFGKAVELLKSGKKVARAGWNGKSMFLFLVPGSVFKVSRPPLLGIYQEGTEIKYHAHIDMKTAQGDVVPWPASQTDVLAEDWTEVA